MLVPSCGSKRRFHRKCRVLTSLFSSHAFPHSAWQRRFLPRPAPAPPAAAGQAPNPDSDKAKTIGTRPAEPPMVLQQLNSAIEQLTARISPAVVQILVTGYGASEESGRGQTRPHNSRARDRLGSHCRPQRLHHDQRSCGRGRADHPRRSSPALGSILRNASRPSANSASSRPD